MLRRREIPFRGNNGGRRENSDDFARHADFVDSQMEKDNRESVNGSVTKPGRRDMTRGFVVKQGGGDEAITRRRKSGSRGQGTRTSEYNYSDRHLISPSGRHKMVGLQIADRRMRDSSYRRRLTGKHRRFADSRIIHEGLGEENYDNVNPSERFLDNGIDTRWEEMNVWEKVDELLERGSSTEYILNLLPHIFWEDGVEKINRKWDDIAEAFFDHGQGGSFANVFLDMVDSGEIEPRHVGKGIFNRFTAKQLIDIGRKDVVKKFRDRKYFDCSYKEINKLLSEYHGKGKKQVDPDRNKKSHHFDKGNPIKIQNRRRR